MRTSPADEFLVRMESGKDDFENARRECRHAPVGRVVPSQGIYGDAVEEIDWSVGKILESHKEKSLDKNTLVFSTRDHGPWCQGNPGGLRGRKLTNYEGGVRVAFIARWPGRIP